MLKTNYSNSIKYLLNATEEQISNSLVEIEAFRTKVNDLEEDINFFLNQYYKYFFPLKNYTNLWYENILLFDLSRAKKNIYHKIYGICDQESSNLIFNTIINNRFHDDLLRIENYFTYGIKQSYSPHDLLSNFIFTHHALMRQISKLKKQKLIPLDHRVYELKQETEWISLKTVEIIMIIKNNIAHCINSLI